MQLATNLLLEHFCPHCSFDFLLNTGVLIFVPQRVGTKLGILWIETFIADLIIFVQVDIVSQRVRCNCCWILQQGYIW